MTGGYSRGGNDGHRLSFQQVEAYTAPTWPSQEHPQQMHLDVLVEDLPLLTMKSSHSERKPAVTLSIPVRRSGASTPTRPATPSASSPASEPGAITGPADPDWARGTAAPRNRGAKAH